MEGTVSSVRTLKTVAPAGIEAGDLVARMLATAPIMYLMPVIHVFQYVILQPLNGGNTLQYIVCYLVIS